MCFKDLFYCFIHYNLVTSDAIGLEFHQRFEMPTVVFAMVHSCIKFKCIANNKSKSCQISHRKKKNPCKSNIDTEDSADFMACVGYRKMMICYF